MLEGRDWHKTDGASAAEIEQLKASVPVALPDAYLAFLSFSNGGEGPLAVQPLNLVLDPIAQVIETERLGTFKVAFPGLFVIGGSGAGEAIAFDVRGASPYPLVAFDMTNTDVDESIMPIAPSFDAALDLIGIEAD